MYVSCSECLFIFIACLAMQFNTVHGTCLAVYHCCKTSMQINIIMNNNVPARMLQEGLQQVVSDTYKLTLAVLYLLGKIANVGIHK